MTGEREPRGLPQSVVLVGPRAGGKTTLGMALAEHLAWDFVDADDLLADRVGSAAGDYLARVGEQEFREVEEEVVRAALSVNERRVLALGGGAVLSTEVRNCLSQSEHFVVFLYAPVEVLVERHDEGPTRPPLTGLPLKEEVERVFANRLPLYKSVSDMELDTFSTNVTVCLRSISDNMGRVDGLGGD